MIHEKGPAIQRLTRPGFPGILPVCMKAKEKEYEVVDGVKVYPILGYEGLYAISKCGKVWSCRRVQRILSRAGNEFTRIVEGSWRAYSITNSGYYSLPLYKNGKARPWNVHRLVSDTFLGEKPSGLTIDHIDRNKLNNRIENLRFATRSQNQSYVPRGMSGENKTGFRGVHQVSKNSFRAKIRLNGTPKVIGSFSTAEQAAKAYDKKAKEFYGEFACPNFCGL